MLTKNILLGSVVLTGALLFTTSCTTSNTIKGSGSDIEPAEMLPVTEVAPYNNEVEIAETTITEITHEPSDVTYKIQNGDNLGKIAKKFNVGVADICELNDIKDKNKIYVGQELAIPSFGTVSANKTQTITATKRVAGSEYIVQKGDCLSKIASKFGIKTATLAEANKITNANSVYAGQKIIIPGVTKKLTTTKQTKAKAPVVRNTETQAPEINLDEGVMIIEEVEITKEVVVDTPNVAVAPVVVEEAITSTPKLPPNKHISSETEDLHSVAQMWGCTVEEIATFNNIPVETILKKGDYVLIPSVTE